MIFLGVRKLSAPYCSQFKSGSADHKVPSPPETESTLSYASMAKTNTIENTKASIVIKPNDHGSPLLTKSQIGDIASDLAIPIHRTAADKTGRTFITVSKKSSAKLQTALTSSTPTNSVFTLPRKTPSIVLVGLDRKYESKDITDTVKRLNSFGNLVTPETFKVLTIKPLKNNNDIFQCIINVSDSIRHAIKAAGDRVFFRENSLRVYDNFHVKRCNKCQSFHHYEGKCSSTVVFCGTCSGAHSTDQCTVADISSFKCINCFRNKLTADNHRAFDSCCQSYKNEQEKVKFLRVCQPLSHVWNP